MSREYVRVKYDGRTCIVCRTPFDTKQKHQMYCTRSGEDACLNKLVAFVRDVISQSFFAAAVTTQGHKCAVAGCNERRLSPVMASPHLIVGWKWNPETIASMTAQMSARCQKHRRDYYVGLAIGGGA